MGAICFFISFHFLSFPFHLLPSVFISLYFLFISFHFLERGIHLVWGGPEQDLIGFYLNLIGKLKEICLRLRHKMEGTAFRSFEYPVISCYFRSCSCHFLSKRKTLKHRSLIFLLKFFQNRFTGCNVLYVRRWPYSRE